MGDCNLHISEMNDSNIIRDRREELGTLLQGKVPAVKYCHVTWKWMQGTCKCVLQTLGQPVN